MCRGFFILEKIEDDEKPLPQLDTIAWNDASSTDL